MNDSTQRQHARARIEYLRVRNFRVLQDVEFKNLTPLTVLIGPNGSGKSTVFDVFAFLAECFEIGLRRAWDKRGRARGVEEPRGKRARVHRVEVPRTRISADHLPPRD